MEHPTPLKIHEAFLRGPAREWIGTHLQVRIEELRHRREVDERAARRWVKRIMTRAPQPPALPAPRAAGDVSGSVETIVKGGDASTAPNFARLVHRFGLRGEGHSVEWKVLLLAMVAELDDVTANRCAALHTLLGAPDAVRGATFGLAASLFDDWNASAMLPAGPLRYFHLIEPVQPGTTPLQWAALQPSEHVLLYARGFDSDPRRSGQAPRPRLDPDVAAVVTPVEEPALAEGGCDADDDPLPESVARDRKDLLSGWSKGGDPVPVAQLTGPDPAGKTLVASLAVRSMPGGPHRLYRLAVHLLPQTPAELTTVARYWERDSVLHDLVLLVDAGDTDPSSPEAQAVGRFLARGGTDRRYALSVREAWSLSTRPTFTVEVAKPEASEQHAAWLAALGPDESGNDRVGGVGEAAAAQLASLLSGQFNLELTTIHQIVNAAAGTPRDDLDGVRAALWDACRKAVRPRMGGLAQRLDARATFDDIVLPVRQKQMLRQIAAQVLHRGEVHDQWGFARRMSRGLGIAALFAGDSGCGKTMAAEAIANGLGGDEMPGLKLDVYRVDLSAVVNKYIGETEKNLRRVFDAAEDGAAILLFDEADALFGKRTEVKDSHDRYANIEINYLLQRIESYRGLAILATNMKPAVDAAFMRRLRFVVDFPTPGRAERREIWARAFPRPPGPHVPGVPLADAEYDWLARFNLTGGNIQTVALNASFLAAARGPAPGEPESRLSMEDVLKAVRAELEKLGRPIIEADFDWHPPDNRRAGAGTTAPRGNGSSQPAAVAAANANEEVPAR